MSAHRAPEAEWQMPTTDDRRPTSNLRFRVEIRGIPFAGYCRVEELESLIEAEKRRGEVREQSADHEARSFGNIILRRAITRDRELWKWHEANRQGYEDRRDGCIRVLDEAGEEAFRVEFCGAWPRRWTMGALDALQPAVLMEEVELEIHSFNIV
jgi:phage tail-like protein